MRVVVILLLLPLAGCLGDSGDATTQLAGVTITWTDFGIPHIVADDHVGLGVGAGYAAAEDDLCMLAEEYVTVAGQRARYFGPGSYSLTSNGQSYSNVQSDTYHRIFNDPENGLVQSSAHWDDTRGEGLLAGYVEGYNRYLQDLPEGRHEACRDAPWLRPITEQDMVNRVNKLQLLASGLFFAPYMVDASPLPGFAQGLPAGRLPTPEGLGMGSNGYALGADATGGAGMLLGNPHFSWSGPERFSMLHLTIPGELDVAGMSLLGVPLVLIGFNDHVAWTHTVSTAWRFTPYELQLLPTDPTIYLHDGGQRSMRTITVDVEVLRDGEVESEPHRIHFSHYGPIIEFPLDDQVGGLPGPLAGEAGLMWTPAKAYAIRDANVHNDRIFQQFYAFGTSQSLDELTGSLETVHGVPWVNTIAAGPDGRAFYGDVSVTPNMPDERWDACNTAIGIALTEAARLPVFDGTTSDCDWLDEGGPQPGTVPPQQMPATTRSDWVINSNDSHWLPHPDGPLEGFDRMIGDEHSERSQRTRMGYVLLEEIADGNVALGDLQGALLASRLHAAEDVVDDIVAETCVLGYGLASDGTLVDFDTPCKVLDAWDRTAGLDARGLALFERFWLQAPQNWAEPFDPQRPVATPTDYIGQDPLAIQALADAVQDLQGAGIAIDAPVRDVRFSERDGQRIPLHGADGRLGSPSMMTFPWNGDGWGEVVHGNSYIQTVTWDDGPVAEVLLTYSQSSDPASPHSSDMTWRYSDKAWVRYPFTSDAIEAAALRSISL